MPYYQGDYYQGDYYQGDGVFGAIGGAIKKVVGGAAKLVSHAPGPVGAVGKAVDIAINPPAPPPSVNLPSVLPPMSIMPPMTNGSRSPFIPVVGKQGPDVPRSMPGAVPEPGFLGGLQRFLPFGQSGYTAAPPGYHVNKAYLRYLKAQAMGKAASNPFNAPRAVNTVVKNRRVNPLNPRALRRSVSRQRGAVSLMRGVLAGTGWTISRRGLGGKKKRRR